MTSKGDRVWTVRTVHHPAHTKPDDVWVDTDTGPEYVRADGYIPDSPELPAVAACLAKPGFIDGLIATIVRALALYDGAEGRLPELARTMDHDRAVLGDLLAALESGR